MASGTSRPGSPVVREWMDGQIDIPPSLQADLTSPTLAPDVVMEPLSARSTSSSVVSLTPHETIESLTAQLADIKKLEKKIKLVKTSKERRLKILKERAGGGGGGGGDMSPITGIPPARPSVSSSESYNGARAAISSTDSFAPSRPSISSSDSALGEEFAVMLESTPITSEPAEGKGSPAHAKAPQHQSQQQRRVHRGSAPPLPVPLSQPHTSLPDTGGMFVSPVTLSPSSSPSSRAYEAPDRRPKSLPTGGTRPPAIPPPIRTAVQLSSSVPSSSAAPPPPLPSSSPQAHTPAHLSHLSPAWVPTDTRRHSLQHVQSPQQPPPLLGHRQLHPPPPQPSPTGGYGGLVYQQGPEAYPLPGDPYRHQAYRQPVDPRREPYRQDGVPVGSAHPAHLKRDTTGPPVDISPMYVAPARAPVISTGSVLDAIEGEVDSLCVSRERDAFPPPFVHGSSSPAVLMGHTHSAHTHPPVTHQASAPAAIRRGAPVDSLHMKKDSMEDVLAALNSSDLLDTPSPNPGTLPFFRTLHSRNPSIDLVTGAKGEGGSSSPPPPPPPPPAG